jgi:hypothetical protein
MSQEIINIGTLPNDGEGDPLRVAFTKINNNFSQIFNSLGQAEGSTVAGATGIITGQVIFTYPIADFVQGMFQINSSDQIANTQNITINTSKTTEVAPPTVINSALNTMSYPPGVAITTYDIVVVGEEVQIQINPLINVDMYHYISYRISTSGAVAAPLLLNGYPTGTALNTQDEINITTQVQQL